MARSRYNVVLNGIATTVQLSDDEARRRGLLPAEEPKAKAQAAANKAQAAANKSAPKKSPAARKRGDG